MKTSGPLKVGIIGGAGWLGGAMADAMLGAGIVQAENLALSYRRARPNRFAGCFWTRDNQALADRSDVIFLSVRPADWPGLAVDATDKLLVSVMAGIRLDALSRHHRTLRVVRALPNAAAEVAMSYTPWITTAGVTANDRDIVTAIFDACGAQDEVASEADVDYLTGLSGSGPAFPALLVAAMMNDAVSHGIDPAIAQRAVNTLIMGAGRLFERRNECPADIVETFRSYRGTTAAAIEAMQISGFEASVANGLATAFKKSVSMGDIS